MPKLSSVAQCKKRVAQLEKALARERENHSETFAISKRLLAAQQDAFTTLQDAFKILVEVLEDYRRQERASISASAAKKKRGRPPKPGGRAEQREIRELHLQFIKEYDPQKPPAWMPPETHARFKEAKERLLNPHAKIKPTGGKRGRPRDDEVKRLVLGKVETAKERDGVHYDAPYLRKLSIASKIPISTLKYWLKGARDLRR